jgi:hypothetical protein
VFDLEPSTADDARVLSNLNGPINDAPFYTVVGFSLPFLCHVEVVTDLVLHS